ncbi:MAG: AI-2E family transporter [Pseudomonadota bacterium]|nr:AI-2E family transporter [Pseudomonadota bacterium]
MLGLDARAARIAWTVAVIALVLWVLFLLRKTFFIFAVAVFLAYMMAPLVRALDAKGRSRMPRAVSVVASFAIVMVIIAVISAWVGPMVGEQSAQLANDLPRLMQKVNVEHLPLPDIAEPWRERISAAIRQSVEGASRSAIPFARGLVEATAGLASNAVFVVLIPVLAFLFLKDGGELRAGILRAMAPVTDPPTAEHVLEDLDQALGRYVRALGLLSVATFISYTAFFTVAGVPFGVLLAAVAALLEFIPVIGPLAAAAVAVIVALVTGYAHVLWIVGFVLVYRLFQDYVLAPKLMSGGIDVHPALIIFGFLAGEQLAGIPGMFLSVPVIAVLVILLRATSTQKPQPTPAASAPDRNRTR